LILFDQLQTTIIDFIKRFYYLLWIMRYIMLFYRYSISLLPYIMIIIMIILPFFSFLWYPLYWIRMYIPQKWSFTRYNIILRYKLLRIISIQLIYLLLLSITLDLYLFFTLIPLDLYRYEQYIQILLWIEVKLTALQEW